MKILITTDWYKPIVNGVVTSVLNLKKELEERGHEVRVLTLSRDYHSYEEDVYKRQGDTFCKKTVYHCEKPAEQARCGNYLCVYRLRTRRRIYLSSGGYDGWGKGQGTEKGLD